MRFLSPVTTALAAVCLIGTLAGTADAQTKSCVRNCLTPYANEPASVQRQVKPKCRAACNAVKAQRQACLNEVNVLFKDASKTCAESLKRIKRGQPPLSVSIPIGNSQDGNVTGQVVTYFYEPGCKQTVRSLWTDAKVGTKARVGSVESDAVWLTYLPVDAPTPDHLQRDPLPGWPVLEHPRPSLHRQPQQRPADAAPGHRHAHPVRHPRLYVKMNGSRQAGCDQLMTCCRLHFLPPPYL